MGMMSIIIRLDLHPSLFLGSDLELNLSMLKSIQLEKMFGIKQLTLDTLRLPKVKLYLCHPLKLSIVHSESVERRFVDRMHCLGYTKFDSELDSTILRFKL